jgi:hypothetical protein
MNSRKVVVKVTFKTILIVDEGVEISEIMENSRVAVDDLRADVEDSEVLTHEVLDSK